MSYNEFKDINDSNKKEFKTSASSNIGRILYVNLNTGGCVVELYNGGNIRIAVTGLIRMVLDKKGALTNPSKLKNWKGWSK